MGISNNNTFAVILGISGTLIISLVLGSYAYTSGEIEKEQKEKREWRSEHQRTLDKRFDEIDRKQDELAKSISKSSGDVQEKLILILEEQKKMNQRDMKGKHK